MHLTFLIYSYFPYGGQQRDFLRIVTECLQRGHQVTVYTRSWQGEIPDQLDVRLLSAKALTRLGVYRRFTQWVVEALDRQPTDLVVGFNKMPHLDVYFAADPCFAAKAQTQRGFYYRFTERYKHFMTYEAAVFQADAPTQVLLLSPQQRRDFSYYYPGCESRLHDLPPGIATDRKVLNRDPTVRQQFRSEFGISEDTQLILQVGSGFRVKGVDRALQAIAALPAPQRRRCRYLLVGQDRPNRFLRLARKLGISDRFDVLPGRDDIPRFFAGADLLLHPAYQESAGYVLLEATIAGLPVLTTATCGYAFHIEQAQSGQVCGEPFSQIELNQRLAAMLEALPNAPWSENGLNYGKNEVLYTLPQAAVDLIEQQAREKRRAG
jgi:UDP-glucose:(heptosyl)LPS alpha-1,3-glucosyltransferase